MLCLWRTAYQNAARPQPHPLQAPVSRLVSGGSAGDAKAPRLFLRRRVSFGQSHTSWRTTVNYPGLKAKTQHQEGRATGEQGMVFERGGSTRSAGTFINF